MSIVRVVHSSGIYSRPVSSFIIKRCYSISPSDSEKKLSPDEAKQQAAQLAMQSIKDFGSLLSSSPDEATQPIDTAPIYEDPKLFGSLSLLHQGQVLKELQDKYDKKWQKLTMKDKLLGYYIAYGDWGVREKFDNWRTLEAPYDLPFVVPSKVKTTSPNKDTIIKKLEPVILAETPVRKAQFDFKRMDGVTKFFIYLTVFIAMFGIYRDKSIGEEGRPKELIVFDRHELARQERIAKEKADEEKRILEEKLALEQKKKQKKWYYLWLR
ncbi:uncharacterized protein J8A68_001563 [[Candida] subhashii]|uniref:Genetic interactor of prohibitin 7, mitochondrial n=1 Tax=[Candida] subhashii TaxID=561895 RepID=A0A8J5UZL7_9ASCO|nr:uncharacterized protein J8A68_001563 [[Candida] subhashii]KAG7664925.1 hypothetical protein J8A68_001563 [[Candida] subhashii]